MQYHPKRVLRFAGNIQHGGLGFEIEFEQPPYWRFPLLAVTAQQLGVRKDVDL